MDVVSARSALLCNFEVLSLLRELDADHLARTKTALRIKKEEESSGNVSGHLSAATEEISENLRTIEVEAIQYLSASFQPTLSQSEARISKLVHDLAPYELTKAEKLQVVNLAPTEPVELYVIVEELEDRLPDRMEDILSCVRSSLVAPPTSIPHSEQGGLVEQIPDQDEGVWDADGDTDDAAVADEMVFDDTGEGAGVEGDLDIDDD